MYFFSNKSVDLDAYRVFDEMEMIFFNPNATFVVYCFFDTAVTDFIDYDFLMIP